MALLGPWLLIAVVSGVEGTTLVLTALTVEVLIVLIVLIVLVVLIILVGLSISLIGAVVLVVTSSVASGLIHDLACREIHVIVYKRPYLNIIS